MLSLSKAWPRTIIQGTLLAAIIAATMQLTLLQTSSPYIAPLWPAGGLAVAALWYLGPKAWPWIALGAVLGRFTAHFPRSYDLMMAGASLVEAYITFCFFRWITEQPWVRRSRPVRFLALFGGATVGSLALAAISTFGRIAMGLEHHRSISSTIIALTASHLLGIITFAPPLLDAQASLSTWSAKSPKALLLAALPFAMALSIVGLIFAEPSPMPLAFLLFPLALFVAMTSPSTLSDLFTPVVSVMFLWGNHQGFGPLVGGTTTDQISLFLFLFAFAITGFFVRETMAQGRRWLPTLVLLTGWGVSALAVNVIEAHKQSLDAAEGSSMATKAESAIRESFELRIGELERLAILLAQVNSPERAVSGGLRNQTERPWLEDTRFVPNVKGIPDRQTRSAELARDTGQPAMAPGRNLGTTSATYELFLPLYHRALASDGESVQERRAMFAGFVVATVDIARLLRGLGAANGDEVCFKVIDGTNSQPLFDSDPSATGGMPLGTETLMLAQYPVSFMWRQGGAFVSHRDFAAMAVAAVTTLLTLALAMIIVNLLSVSQRASELAQRMTAELGEREGLWKTLTESAPVGVVQMDKGGHCVYVNPRWVTMTGIDWPKARGRGWIDAVRREDRPAIEAAWQEFLDGQPFDVQFRTIKTAQAETWVAGIAATTRAATGQISGYLITMLDISEIKRQQRDLLASSKMSSLGEMAGGIAHEINNPLMIIQAMADSLRRAADRGELDHDKARQSAQGIDAVVQRIAKIISGLRTFARNAEKDPMARTSIGSVIEATLGLCQQRFRAHGVEVRLSGDLTAQLDCRTVQLSQVLLNLLNNAFDAIERAPDRWIALAASELKDNVELTVTDSGSGIPPAIASRIMEPFFTTKPVGRGTGLGLSISKGIVEDHGGTIVLDLESPHTRFVITLPRDSIDFE